MIYRDAEIHYNKTDYTIAEYLEIEDNCLEKHEYYKGRIFLLNAEKLKGGIIGKDSTVGDSKHEE